MTFLHSGWSFGKEQVTLSLSSLLPRQGDSRPHTLPISCLVYILLRCSPNPLGPSSGLTAFLFLNVVSCLPFYFSPPDSVKAAEGLFIVCEVSSVWEPGRWLSTGLFLSWWGWPLQPWPLAPIPKGIREHGSLGFHVRRQLDLG